MGAQVIQGVKVCAVVSGSPCQPKGSVGLVLSPTGKFSKRSSLITRVVIGPREGELSTLCLLHDVVYVGLSHHWTKRGYPGLKCGSDKRLCPCPWVVHHLGI